MAKKPQRHYASSTQVVDQIIRLLEKSRVTTGMHTFEHFQRALGVWDAALRQVKMGPWLEACRGLERGLQPLSEALGILMLEATANYHDVLGAVYMALGQGNKLFGQFFTPDPIAWFMAEMLVTDLKLPGPGEPPLRINEPTCGSGVMILAMAGVIEQRWPGAIGRGQVEFSGTDLDGVCVAMCRLNMLLHGIGRKAQTIEELTPEQRRVIERTLGHPLRASATEHAPSAAWVDAGAMPAPADEAPAAPLPDAAAASHEPVATIEMPERWTAEQVPTPSPASSDMPHASAHRDVTFYFTVARGWVHPDMLPEPVMLPAASFAPQFPSVTLPSQVPEVAIDCGAFSATKQGGYRFTPEQYMDWIARIHPVPSWAACMDLCCTAEVVRERQEWATDTAWQFWNSYRAVPYCWVPTVQGWEASDYAWHARQLRPLIEKMQAHYGQPSAFRVGIGSLCRRAGAHTIQEVVSAVAAELPVGVGFHLWGIKRKELEARVPLHPQVLSMDSAAWSGHFGKAIEARRRSGKTERQWAWEDAAPRYSRSIKAALEQHRRYSLF